MDHVINGEKVMYDDNPGTVESVNRGSALVRWDYSGRRTIESLSDLVAATDLQSRTLYRASTERLVTSDTLPGWIVGDLDDRNRLHLALWTKVTAEEVFYSYWPDGSFMARWTEGDADLIHWTDLPTWLKGAFDSQGEARLVLAKQARWTKKGEVYTGNLPDGFVLGRFSRE